MFGAGTRPAATLALEASRDLHFDVLFNHAAARAYRCDLVSDGATQAGWNLVPVVDIIAVAQPVAKKAGGTVRTDFRLCAKPPGPLRCRLATPRP
jgi:hypothetical protein